MFLNLKIFCNHKWEILSETTTECKAERMGKLTGEIPKPVNQLHVDGLYEKQVIQLVTCPKCGAFKKIVTKI